MTECHGGGGGGGLSSRGTRLHAISSKCLTASPGSSNAIVATRQRGHPRSALRRRPHLGDGDEPQPDVAVLVSLVVASSSRPYQRVAVTGMGSVGDRPRTNTKATSMDTGDRDRGPRCGCIATTFSVCFNQPMILCTRIKGAIKLSTAAKTNKFA